MNGMQLKMNPARAVFCMLATFSGKFRKRGYISGSWGFVSARRNQPMHEAAPAQFAEVIERFLVGDWFDMLYISKANDRYGGLMLSGVNSRPRLSISFKTHSEPDRISAFSTAMSAAGYVGEQNSDGFNGGFLEENRITRFKFQLPDNATESIAMIDLALEQIQPGYEASYFVSGSRFSDGPGGRKGVGLSTEHDPLADLFIE